MANMREVNKAIKAAHPELKVEAVRGDGYVYFDGEGFDEIPSIYSNPVGTSTADMIRMCVEAVSEYSRIKALAEVEAQLDADHAAQESTPGTYSYGQAQYRAGAQYKDMPRGESRYGWLDEKNCGIPPRSSEQPAPEPEQQHHFFAGTRYGWAVSTDYETAIKGAAELIGCAALQSHNRISRGLIAVVCRVELPVKAQYTISNYVPNYITEGGVVTRDLVPISKTDTIRITSTKGKWIYA